MTVSTDIHTRCALHDHDQIGALVGRVLHILAEIGTKLLCIDEVHHLLAGSQREQRRALNLLKFVANELKIAVVAVGTHDAFHAMQIDSQVASRFEQLLLPRWTEIDGFRGFVTGYGRLLPLRKPSPFWRSGNDPNASRTQRRQQSCRRHRLGLAFPFLARSR